MSFKRGTRELSEPPAEAWDEEFAGELLGRTVLVGITRANPDGETIEQIQFFGDVESVDRLNGILLRLSGQRIGQEYNLPPDIRAFRAAKPGQYELRSTGEIVADPDYLCTWMIEEPRS
jgi:hypothetical protein